MAEKQEFSGIQDFYPYYLSEHSNATCRRLHFIGSALVLLMLGYTLLTQQWVYLWTLPVIGYGFAWVGHFFFEHNKPATFQYPWLSLACDWVMFKDIIMGKVRW